MSLSDRLREIRLAFEAGPTPAADISILDRHVKELRASGRPRQAIQVGAMAPEFSLRGASGETVELRAALANGPVVLTWFRGSW